MLTDTSIHIPPEYDTLQPPAVGGSYADPVFGSTINQEPMRTVTIELAETEIGLVAVLHADPPISFDSVDTERERVAGAVVRLLIDRGVQCQAAPAIPLAVQS